MVNVYQTKDFLKFAEYTDANNVDDDTTIAVWAYPGPIEGDRAGTIRRSADSQPLTFDTQVLECSSDSDNLKAISKEEAVKAGQKNPPPVKISEDEKEHEPPKPKSESADAKGTTVDTSIADAQQSSSKFVGKYITFKFDDQIFFGKYVGGSWKKGFMANSLRFEDLYMFDGDNNNYTLLAGPWVHPKIKNEVDMKNKQIADLGGLGPDKYIEEKLHTKVVRQRGVELPPGDFVKESYGGGYRRRRRKRSSRRRRSRRRSSRRRRSRRRRSGGRSRRRRSRRRRRTRRKSRRRRRYRRSRRRRR